MCWHADKKEEEKAQLSFVHDIKTGTESRLLFRKKKRKQKNKNVRRAGKKKLASKRQQQRQPNYMNAD